jgi:hypothetical protein
MRQGSSVALEAASGEVLHPALEAALDSLDVELEEELTRYRRQKHRMARQVGYKQHIPIWKPTHRQVQKSAIDLPFKAISPHQPGAEQPFELPQPSFKPSQSKQVSPPLDRLDVESANVEADVWAEPVPERSHHLPRNPAQTGVQTRTQTGSNHPLPDRPTDRSFPDRPASPPGLTGGKLATVQAQPNAREELDEPQAPASALIAIPPDSIDNPSGFADVAEENPEDYLASSEELLRSIAEESLHGQAEQETNLLNSLLSPLGIGSMLLLLLSSATLGYVIMHPSSLDFLTPQETASTEPSNNPTATTSTEKPAAPVPGAPNLAADEFVDLNLDTLSTLPRSPKAQPSTSPSPNAAGTNPFGAMPPSQTTSPFGSPATGTGSTMTPDSPSVSNPNPPAPEPIPQYAPPASAPAPQEPVSVAPAPVYETPYEPPVAIDYPPPIDHYPEVAASPSSPTASPAEASYYYVVTPYSGDPSLNNAREAVPDAYVRNFDSGASVQLGAFSDPAKAEELLQQLESQGIPAEIYHP